MSATYIVLYAGAPIRLPSLDLTTRERASQFISVADAWFEIYRANLNPRHCRVELLEEPSERLHDVRPEENVVPSTFDPPTATYPPPAPCRRHNLTQNWTKSVSDTFPTQSCRLTQPDTDLSVTHRR